MAMGRRQAVALMPRRECHIGPRHPRRLDPWRTLNNAGRRPGVVAAGGCVVRLAVFAVLCAALLTSARAESPGSEWLASRFERSDTARGASGDKPGSGRAAADAKARAAGMVKGAVPGKEDGEEPNSAKPVFKRPVLAAGRAPFQWRITRAEWTPQDHAGFEEFVRRIGESACRTVHECLTDPVANPRFHAANPAGLTFEADCADLPYVLRAYYAWQVGLPFSFSIQLAPHRVPGKSRRAVSGNQIIDRYDIVGPGPDIRQALAVIRQFPSTEHFRTPPAYSGKMLPDYYPVRIDRESIRPGTVVFDPDGHVAIVYEVTPDGRIRYIDSHPDNSLTRGIYGREFGRALPGMGAGFKRWRPQVLNGAIRQPDGTLTGGAISLATDAELSDWSDEQFFGTEMPRPRLWSAGRFFIEGTALDYYDYVRMKLAGPDFRYDPLQETRELVRGLCRDLHYRVQSVDAAVRAGIHEKPQPPRLPANIYATQGEWEIYSTPSRDARLKTGFEELRDEVERFLKLAHEGSPLIRYDGGDLRRDLLEIYQAESADCPVTYVRSDGTPQTLGFEEVRRRLFLLSFDPYHCIERRWGASQEPELATCRDGPDKRAWYLAEQRLRYQTVRTYGEPMGWSLTELQNPAADIGMPDAPDVDVLKVLEPGEEQRLASVRPARRRR